MAGTRGWAEYWRDDARGVEAMYARFRDHVFAPHSHDAYSFGVTEAGAQQFHCRGGLHTSSAGMAMTLNPDDPHDGHAAAELGYHYRIVHVSPQAVRAVLADAAATDAGASGAAALPLFTRPVLGAHLRGATRPPRIRTLADGAQRAAARRARALMREAYPEPVSVELLAEAAGCSRFALYRAFSAEFGMPPSDYERQLRLRHARSLLAAGTAPADVAAATGFADQAHLARWFKRAYGITPGIFVRGAGR